MFLYIRMGNFCKRVRVGLSFSWSVIKIQSHYDGKMAQRVRFLLHISAAVSFTIAIHYDPNTNGQMHKYSYRTRMRWLNVLKLSIYLIEIDYYDI